MTVSAVKRRARRIRRAKQRTAGRVFLAFLGTILSLSGLWCFGGETLRGKGLLGKAFVSRLGSTPAEDSFLLDAPFLDQRPNFPTGCESVSAVMALQYAGVAMTPEEFVEGYLPLGTAPHRDEAGRRVGCDPREAFPGDPRKETGWGCYAPVIGKALREAAPELTVEELSGVPLEELCESYLEKGIPLLLWVTIDMVPPEEDVTFQIEDSGETFRWISPLHCALLTGRDQTSYYFNDPLAGKNVAYPKDAVALAYEGLGSQAIAVFPGA